MSETVINTIIQAVAAIIVAYIGIGTWRNSVRTKGIEKQVVNDHKGKPDLRSDIDSIKDAVRFISRDIGGLREEQRQTRKEVYDQGVYGRENRHMIHEVKDEIDDLEDTIKTLKGE